MPLGDTTTDRIVPTFTSSIKQGPVFRLIILTLFFLSGATSLIYEVVWQKALHQILGDTTIATAVILASFMGGLALGSIYFGRLADRIKNHLAVYAFLEAGIGLFALVFPLIAVLLKDAYVVLFQNFQHIPALFTLLRFFISFAVLLIPTFFMGGTLPLIIKFLTRNFENLGWTAGKIYGINTLGGAIGSFAAGFFLIASLGIATTTWLTVIVNFIIAGVISVFWLINRTPHAVQKIVAQEQQPPTPDRLQYPASIFHFVLAAYALSGFCALAYEVLWNRSLIFFLSNDTYSFTIMLSTTLFSLAVGSLLFSKFVDGRKNLLQWFGLIEILIGCFAIAAIYEFAFIDDVTFKFALEFLCRGAINWHTVNIGKVIISFFILFFPALLMGFTFPMVAKIYTQNFSSLGLRIGNMYSANTLGSVVGPIAAAFILIPLIGIVRGIFVTAMINIVLGFITLLINPRTNTGKRVAYITGFIILCAVLKVIAPFNEKITLYSPLFSDLRGGGKIHYYKEGTAATVTVHSQPLYTYEVKSSENLLIEVDGTNVAGTHPMLRATQKIQGHIPLLLYKARCGRDPQYVFSLGLGTGDASYSATCHNIKRIDCLELVDAEIDANKFFRHINHDLLHNPKFNLIINDARNHLLGTTQKYDIIASDAVHPEVNINTFTQEYFELAKSRLTDDGFCSAWLPLFNLSTDNQMVLFKTFQSVFPYVSIWYLPDFMNIHALLVGSRKELKIDMKLLQEEFDLPLVKQSLAEADITHINEILNCFIADEAGLKSEYEKHPLNTDDNLYLAYNIPKQQERGMATVAPNLQFFNTYGKSVFPFITNAGDSLQTFFDAQFKARTCVLEAIALDFNSQYAEEIRILKNALAIDTSDKYAKSLLKRAHVKLGLNYQSAKKPQDAFMEYDAALAVDPDFPEALYYSGRMLIQMGRLDEARQKLAHGLEVEPKGARIMNALAFLDAKQGNFTSAQALYEKALELDPYIEIDAYQQLATIYMVKERSADAISLLKKGIAADPRYLESRLMLAYLYSTNGDQKGARRELNEILKIDPQNAQARDELARLKG
jgi:spermidine synthase